MGSSCAPKNSLLNLLHIERRSQVFWLQNHEGKNSSIVVITRRRAITVVLAILIVRILLKLSIQNVNSNKKNILTALVIRVIMLLLVLVVLGKVVIRGEHQTTMMEVIK